VNLALLALFTVLFVSACRKPLPPKPPSAHQAGGGDVVADAIDTGGIPLPATCTSTGPELCFDAIDNNCNGVIDEGCGIGTGPLQFTIAWPEGPDVDLKVTYRKKGEPPERSRSLPELTKDRDCGRPQNNCHGQNIENVYFSGDRPPPGIYQVEIKLDAPEDVKSAVTVTFGARVGQRTFAFPVELTPTQQPAAPMATDSADSKKLVFEIR
jgi:tRNA (guanosine-2'-O-)-methyltransferase